MNLTQSEPFEVKQEIYEKLKNNIEKSWSQWKKKLCNDLLLTSAHSLKL